MNEMTMQILKLSTNDWKHAWIVNNMCELILCLSTCKTVLQTVKLFYDIHKGDKNDLR